MSGPIVRTGATPEFSEGWDRVFGKQAARKTGKAAGKAAPKAAKAKKATARPRKAKKR